MPTAEQKKLVEEHVDEVAAEEEFASFDDLWNKPPRTDTVTIKSPDGKQLKIQLQAMGSTEYDELVAKHPPKKDQRERGQFFDPDTFAPALLSRCSMKPKLTLDQTTKLYQAKAWSPGELGAWFLACQRLCNAGLDIPFNEGD